MATPSPEQAKGWLDLLLDIAQKATPITLLVLLVWLWYQQREIGRVHAVNATLWTQLVEAQKAQVELARQCGGQR